MALLKKWRDTAYSETANKGDLQRFWNTYFEAETEISVNHLCWLFQNMRYHAIFLIMP